MSRIKIIKTLTTVGALVSLLSGCYNFNQTRTVYTVAPAASGGQCVQQCVASRNQCMAQAKKKYSVCVIPQLSKTANGYVEEPLHPQLWGRNNSSCTGMPLDDTCGEDIDSSCKSDFDSCMQSCGASVSVYKSPICNVKVE